MVQALSALHPRTETFWSFEVKSGVSDYFWADIYHTSIAPVRAVHRSHPCGTLLQTHNRFWDNFCYVAAFYSKGLTIAPHTQLRQSVFHE
jgi:hypothetical protein